MTLNILQLQQERPVIYNHSCCNVAVSTLYDDTIEQAESQERATYIFFYLFNYHLPELKDILCFLSHFCSLDQEMMQVCFRIMLT